MFKCRDKAFLNLPLSLHIFKAAPFFPIHTRKGSKIMTKEGRTEEGSRSSTRLDRGPAAKELVPSVHESKGKERLSAHFVSYTRQEGATGRMASLHLSV